MAKIIANVVGVGFHADPVKYCFCSFYGQVWNPAPTYYQMFLQQITIIKFYKQERKEL